MFLRIFYSKKGKFVFMGHLDTIFHIEKILRRMEIDFVKGRGYKRKIKFSTSPPLKTGFSSDCEFVDLETEKEYSPDYINSEVLKAFPEEMKPVKVVISKEKIKSQPKEFVFEKEGRIFKFSVNQKITLSPPAKKIDLIF